MKFKKAVSGGGPLQVVMRKRGAEAVPQYVFWANVRKPPYPRQSTMSVSLNLIFVSIPCRAAKLNLISRLIPTVGSRHTLPASILKAAIPSNTNG